MVTETRLTLLPVASWGSIIGGVVTVFAVSILLSLLGSSIGLGMIDAHAENPVEGVGVVFGIWSAISLVISLAAGGFVAGRLAGNAGATHGFLVWAAALLLASMLSMAAIGGAVSLAGKAVGGVFSAAGKAGSVAAQGAGDVASWISEEFDLNLDIDIDAQELRSDVRRVLRESDIEVLQPRYLREQLQAARQDVAAALRELRRDDATFDQVASDLVGKLSDRAEHISNQIDRDEIVGLLTENTAMTREEAEDLVAGYQETVDAITHQLDNAGEQIDAARQELAELEQQARDAADEAAAALAKSTFWAFLGLILGAVIAGVAGYLGMRSRPEEDRLYDPFRR